MNQQTGSRKYGNKNRPAGKPECSIPADLFSFKSYDLPLSLISKTYLLYCALSYITLWRVSYAFSCFLSTRSVHHHAQH